MCEVQSLDLNSQELLLEIALLLQSTSEEVSDANALRINQELQQRLEQVRGCMVALLNTIRARYARNEQILIRRLQSRPRASAAGTGENIGLSGAVLRGGTFRFKGNLYFRDVDGRSCPNNSDYEQRCANEMFPTDFDLRSKHVWTMVDKKNIVMGVKEQLLDHVTFKQQATDPTLSTKRKHINAHVQTLASLLGNADSSFVIDWNQISALNVQYRHSSYSCEAMWQVYLHPQLKRDDWSRDEDECLLDTAKQCKMQDWQAIAAKVGQRSDYQCFVRFQTSLRLCFDSGNEKWSNKDDERLKTIVSKNTANGITNWGQVMEHFPGRSKSTLIGRYTYVLHPSISHAAFTVKEDMMLFAAVEEYNGKFYCFPRTLFPNRSLAQLRTRYYNVLAQRNKTDSWSEEDDAKLMNFVTNHGTMQWVDCAAYLGNHTRTSCRTRFLVIKRFLEQHPDAQVEDFPRRRSTKYAMITQENWEQRLEEWKENPDSLIQPRPKRIRVRARIKTPQPIAGHSENDKILRGTDLEIYEYFKYAYNLRLDADIANVPLPRDEINLRLVASALRYSPSTIFSTPLKSVALPRPLRRCYNKMLSELPAMPEESDLDLLPPNWSTVMGFRAICILSVDCRNREHVQLEYDESALAVKLFRQRLRTLFYRTTLLSRLEPQVFDGLPQAMMALPRPAVTYKAEAACGESQQVVVEKSSLTSEELARMQLETLNSLLATRKTLRQIKTEPGSSDDDNSNELERDVKMEIGGSN